LRATLKRKEYPVFTAMIECFKAYFSRERTLSIKLTHADGKQIEITARNVDMLAVREALEAIASARSA
jgi:hypothetical protein